jgi:Flp pilus assembly protein TadB
MPDQPRVLLIVSLLGAAVTWLLLMLPASNRAERSETIRQRIAKAIGTETARVALLQADLDWLPVRWWIGIRFGVALMIGIVTFTLFQLWLLAVLSVLASYHLIGAALEGRRRKMQLARHRALLDAVRYGAAVMSRAGNLLQMLIALAEHGPWQVRRLFRNVVERVQESRGETTLADAIRGVQQRFADPMIDDIALAFILHEQHGSRLVPALETLAADWDQTLALEREAKALRAGVEASVLILTILPFVFLVVLRFLAPAMLTPFQSPVGELLFGGAVAWMALGYRVLQQMAAPPVEERVSLTLETNP